MKFLKKPFGLDEVEIPLGKVVIIQDRCKGCGYCIRFCPEKVLNTSKDHNEKGYHYPEVVKEDACIHCGFCEMICPEFAIWSVAAGEKSPEIDRRVSVDSS